MGGFEEIARSFLESVASDTNTYTSVKARIVRNSEFSLSLVTPSHLQFAYAGRPAGKAPPLDAMLDFIRSKNILFDGMSERGTAFAIQRSIAKKGTKNYKPNAVNILEQTVLKYQSKYESGLSKEIFLSTSRDVEREFEQMWDKEEALLKKFKI